MAIKRWFFKKQRQQHQQQEEEEEGSSSKQDSWKFKFSSSSFKFKYLNIHISFLDDILFKIISVFEAILLVSALCFFYLFCGCHI
ncbi:uncharacterized protein LOC113286154 [Papaver somniferum]|uniref:uncharacterized protein LOC113286154 n=1 Tax=Papaver somniferum TaxID=3469 RepID=UPI000E70434C|nr:uncharacterized protein LOC113286154 [Papaver somniferum]